MIIATNGKDPKKGFEFPLNFQQIFSAFLDNDAPRKGKAENYADVLRGNIISAPFVETNIDFKTLDISNEFTDT